ncbi:MAG: hypothetical protein KTR30_06635 [Saprospiraceae bacterium]|nr:hypothetical protein [Saprospiraceae bacterium]
MNSLLNRIIYFGIEEDTPLDERIKLKGINSISLALCPALLFIVILESLNPAGSLAFVGLIGGYLAIIAVILYLNIKHQFQVSYNLILFAAPFGVFAEIVLFGNSLRADIVFMILFVAAIFLRPSNRTLTAAFVLYTLLLVTSQIYLYHNPPIIESQPYLITEYTAMILTFLTVILIIKNYETEKAIEQEKMETLLRELAEKNQELVRVNRDLEDFTFATSHDLKTPIRLLVSFSDLLRRKKELQQDKETQEYLEFINENSRHMYQLIDNLLSYARVKDHPPKKEWVDLQALIEELVEVLQRAVPALEIEIPQKLPRILSHYDTLRLLFHNLLENGIKYNTSKTVQIRIVYQYERGQICFRIADNGIGIDSVYNDYIFKMFKRLHNSSSFPGTGIGLSTCKRILEGWGGQISFESQLEIGTTFILKWPVKRSAYLPATPPKMANSTR